MTYFEAVADRAEHPVDIVERLASLNEWSFERDEDDEISIVVSGRWTDYTVAFTWLEDIEALHISCAFDLKLSEGRRAAAGELATLVNEHLWIGHFDLWPNENVAMFRHAMLLAGGVEPSGRQCATMLQAAIDACERHYQAFQFVAWSDKSAREALDAALFETAGEA
jgi:hypothetical protein